MRSEVIYPAVSLALAWFAGRLMSLASPPLFLAAATLTVTLVVAWIAQRSRRGRFLAAHLVILASGTFWPRSRVPPCRPVEGLLVAEVLRVEPVSAGVRQPVELLVVRHGDLNVPQRAWGDLEGDRVVLPGDEIVFRGRLSGFEERRNPSDFDFAALAEARGWSCRLGSTSLLAHRYRERGWRSWLPRARLASYRALERLPDPARSVARAIALGARTELADELRDRWSHAGIAHLLAISGLHVTLVFGAIVFGIRGVARCAVALGVRVVHWRIWAASIGWLVSCLYCVWAGSPSSGMRALGMLLALSVRFGDRMPSLHALAVALVVIVIADDGALYDRGLWLSGIAVAALLASDRSRSAMLSRYSWSRSGLNEGLGRPIGLQTRFWSMIARTSEALIAPAVATMPLVAHSFRSIAWAGPLLNAIALPLGTLLLTPLCLLASGLAEFNVAAPLLDLLTVTTVCLDYLADFAAGFETPVSSPSWIVVILASALAVASAWVRPAWRWTIRCTLAMTLIVQSSGSGSDEIRLVHLAVGQGDSTLLELPGNRAWLIDGGGRVGPGRWDPGRAHVVPALLDRGVFRLERVIATHGDGDHINGLHAVLDRIDVDELLWNGERSNPGMVRLLEHARRRGVRIRAVRGSARTEFMDGSAEVYRWPDAAGQNDASLMTLITYGDFLAFLPGDIGSAAEAWFLASSSARAGQIDHLLAPHHGSDSSSSAALVGVLRPRQVVVSVGRRNRYGLPAAEVLERYRAAGSEVYRLDQVGQVEVRSDGRRSELRVFRSRGKSRDRNSTFGEQRL